MRHPRWIISVLLIAVIALVYRFWILGTFIEPADAVGLTETQVRERYGEPDWVIPDSGDGEIDWVYYRGLRGSSLEFREGVVVAVYHRTR